MQIKENHIRLALLVDGMSLPVWQFQMIERLLLIEHVKIAVVLQDISGQKPALIRRVFGGVLNLFSLLEKRLFDWDANARSQSDIGSILDSSLILNMAEPEVARRFEQASVDLVIDLRHQGHSLQYPHYCYSSSTQQVWRHFYDKSGSADLLKAGVAEFCSDESVLNSGVISCTESGSNTCLLWCGSGINRPLFSQNVDQMLWKTVDFIPALFRQHRSVEALSSLNMVRKKYHDSLAHLQFPDNQNSLASDESVISFYIPTLFKSGFRSLFQLGKKVINRLPWNRVQEQWVLLLGEKEAVTTVDQIQGLTDFKKIIPPVDRFWADPFLISRDGQDYVFFEELIYSQGRGTLACMTLNERGVGGHSQPVTILDKPYHLSYPFMFEYQGELYMMPESAENHTLDIYVCTQFPHQWEWVKTAMDNVEAYDATLYEDEQGEWWMFVCMRHHEYASTNELLYLFSASNPLSGHWEPHPCNPIVTDPSTARPAGNLIRQNGKLYRPSQNCAGSYGKGLNLNEVMTLNHQEYHEQTCSRVIPAGRAELDGVHTLNYLKDRVVSDGILLRR